MFYRSIRFKITILYMAMLALTLTSFSVILYHNVKRGLHSNMDTLLKSRAGGIAKAIDTYWETSNLEAVESGISADALRKRRNVNFAKIAQKWVKEESTDPKLLDILVQVFDTDGRAITSSKNTEGLTEISRKNFLPVLQGRSRFDTISLRDQAEEMDFRVFATPVFENEKVAYIVQVASPVDSIDSALASLKVTLFVLFPVTVLVTGIMGSFLAKAALHPVDNMIRTIHQITAENMKLKIASPGTKDEIQKLAETFNDMLERLERAFTSQRQLFEDLSHELKTPLTILRGEFEVALKKLRVQQEYEALLRSALEEVNKIIKLAEDLLILAKFDSKELPSAKERLDLNNLMQGLINNMRSLAHLKGVEMVFHPGPEMPIMGDEGQLATLFANIIDNAIKYTPQNGRVDAAADKRGSIAKVEIKDTGMGIPEEEIAHIFDRFYRVDKSRGNSGGFGLGLSIARSIADAHGGNIEVESVLGKGTTFRIFLPLAH